VVAPDGKRTEDLAALVAAEVPGAEPVHRIDADTTGIVLFAKTRPVQTALEDAFKAHAVEKVYLAIVRGHPRHEGTHRSYLVKVDAGQGFERWVGAQGMRDTRGAPAQTKTAGREAITRWRLVERLGLYASLLEVRPETGRHHQIRLHMSELGHGLLGDTRYGDRRDPVTIARHMLHAAEIALMHPVSQKRLVLKASLPADFKTAMAKLKSQ
jgi:RluA family pseudouridine synthase